MCQQRSSSFSNNHHKAGCDLHDWELVYSQTSLTLSCYYNYHWVFFCLTISCCFSSYLVLICLTIFSRNVISSHSFFLSSCTWSYFVLESSVLVVLTFFVLSYLVVLCEHLVLWSCSNMLALFHGGAVWQCWLVVCAKPVVGNWKGEANKK